MRFACSSLFDIHEIASEFQSFRFVIRTAMLVTSGKPIFPTSANVLFTKDRYHMISDSIVDQTICLSSKTYIDDIKRNDPCKELSLAFFSFDNIYKRC